MPVSRTSRPPKLRTVELDVGTVNPLEVTFNVRKLTPGWIARMDEGEKAGDIRANAKGLAEVAVDWNFAEEDGSKTPLTAEFIADAFDLEEIGKLMEGLVKAAIPASEEGNDSSDTSPTPSTASSSPPESHPNGQPTSALPEPSASPSPT